jgi:outer membrane protein assembly factor BamB
LFFGAVALPVISGNNLLEKEQSISRSDEWPKYCYDLLNTGYTSSVGKISSPYEKWTYTANNEVNSCPTIAEIDNDGKAEVLVGSRDAFLYCLEGETGAIQWAKQTSHQIWSGASIGNICGELWETEVVVGSDRIYCLDGSTQNPSGSVLWYYVADGFFEFSSPALYDVDDDGEIEVIVGCDDGKVYCLDGSPEEPNGEVEWSYDIGYEIVTSPAIGDVDGDGEVEVLIGANDGTFVCLDGSPASPSGHMEWDFKFYGRTESSPTIGDVDQDGVAEVVIGTHDGQSAGIYCFEGTTGYLEWYYFKPTTIGHSSPAIADVDGDGEIEVIVGIISGSVICLDGSPSQTSGELEWSYSTGDKIHSSPALADIDNDDEIEVIIGSLDGKLYCLDGSPADPPAGDLEWEFNTHDEIWGSPALGDVDGDGFLEIIIGSKNHKVYCIDSQNSPPFPPTITGETHGKSGVSYKYEFTAIDPDNDNIGRYIIEWGHGPAEEVSGNFESGETIEVYHTFPSEDTYIIKSRAVDINGLIGGDGMLQVTMPRNRITDNSFFINLLDMVPILERILSKIF